MSAHPQAAPDRASPQARLDRLLDGGDLRLVAVIGVARSNSTVVARLLGQRLHGTVYEPAMPVSADPDRHYARTILEAYDLARARGVDGPVALAVKDLSLFVTKDKLDRIARHAAHAVFTIRDPLPQHRSLTTQFAHEFSPLQRLDALWRYPVEVGWLTWYLGLYGSRYLRRASAEFGFSPIRIPQLTVAGWNLESWQAIADQFATLKQSWGGARITVLDAALMRLDPAGSTGVIEAVAAGVAVMPISEPVEHAGHSRMYPRSRWAEEALATSAIKPVIATPLAPPIDRPMQQMLRRFYPLYGSLFYDGLHAQRREADPARPGAPVHLLEESTAEAALWRLLKGSAAE